MVAYGPWSEPIEYTETWTLGIVSGGDWDGNFSLIEKTIDPVPEDNGSPIAESAYRNTGGLGPRHFLSASMQDSEQTLNEDLDDGRYGTPALSADAWDNLFAVNSNVVFSSTSIPNEGGVDPPTLTYSHTNQQEFGTFSYFVHRENWYANAVEFVPEWVIRNGSSVNWSAVLGLPDDPPDENHLYTEIDPDRNTQARYSEPISLTVDFTIGGDGRWGVYVVDTDTPAVEWKVSLSDTTDTLPLDAQRIMGQPLGNAGSFEYDVAPVEAWKQEAGTSVNYAVPRPKMPHLGIVWEGGFPGDAMDPPKEYPTFPHVTFTYKWRTARWRWVLAEPESVPYRRNFPRDDSLAGGARRNYPPSRAIQSGIRTTGGYL